MTATETELKQSNFRKTIVEDDFKFSMRKVALAGGLTMALLFLTLKVPYAAYIIYPITFLTRFASETVTNLAILAYLLILSYLLLYLFVFRKQKSPRHIRLPCPYCEQNVRVFKDWKCHHCAKNQGVEKHITERCFQCGKMQERYSCEHCQQDLLL
jgi:hypothetical protein